MSVHARITPEAAAALAAQKRTSTVSALIISVLGMFLLCLILFVIALTVEMKSPPEIISFASGVEESEDIEKPEMTSEVERKPSAPSSSMAKVIATNTPSPTAVPVPDIEVTEPSLDFGNGDDFGDGWGDGDGWGARSWDVDVGVIVFGDCQGALEDFIHVVTFFTGLGEIDIIVIFPNYYK